MEAVSPLDKKQALIWFWVATTKYVEKCGVVAYSTTLHWVFFSTIFPRQYLLMCEYRTDSGAYVPHFHLVMADLDVAGC